MAKAKKSSRKKASRRRGAHHHAAARKSLRAALRSGSIPTLARHGRLFNRPSIISIAVPGGVSGDLKAHRRRKKSSRRKGSKRKMAANPRYVVMNRKRRSSKKSSRKGSKKSSRRKSSRRPTAAMLLAAAAKPRRRRRRKGTAKKSAKKSSRRRSSRRRTSRKTVARKSSRRRSSRLKANRRRGRRRMRKNVLVQRVRRTSKKGSLRTVGGPGSLYQVVEYGKKTSKGKRRGYPVMMPASIVTSAAVRRFKFGGIAKRKHEAKRAGMAKNSRRRRGSRRGSRRNPRYVVMNGRRRRMRRNLAVYGVDVVKGIVVPGVSVLGGLVAARALAMGAVQSDAVRNLLDRDSAPDAAWKTRVAANVVGIAGTLAIGATKMASPYRATLGWAVAGMGASLAGMALARLLPNQAWAQSLAGMGEYVNQPLSGMRYATAGMGEYVNQPLGAYVTDPSSGMGEYVEQPLSGMQYAAAGIGTMYAAAGADNVDPSDQGAIDGLMDVMEAAAGTMEAAAGMGTLYAAAGLGAEADAELQDMYAALQPPFASIQTPTDIARPVDHEMLATKPVRASLVTAEGRGGYAGGLFSGTLFGSGRD
jgi:hypothetical protein